MTHPIVPYTAAELQQVVNKLEWAESVFLTDDQYNEAARHLSEIQVYRQYGEGEIIGNIVFYDGWIGFVFTGQETA